MMGKTSCILHPKFENSHQSLLIVVSVSFDGLQLVKLHSKLQANLLPATRDVVGKVEPLACRIIDHSNTKLFHGGCFTIEILFADTRAIL